MLQKVRLSGDEQELVNECFRSMVRFYQDPTAARKKVMNEAHARVQVSALIKAGFDINRLVSMKAVREATNGSRKKGKGRKSTGPLAKAQTMVKA